MFFVGSSFFAELPFDAQKKIHLSDAYRQRLKKAARYAGAGLAVAPPFVARVSLGESSLEEVLTRGGVDWKR